MATTYREKRENELSEHVHKACNSLECAPKQKHVRWCIVYAYDHTSTVPFWNSLKAESVLSNEIQCFKGLVVIHKILVDGPQYVLRDALRELNFLEDCVRFNSSTGSYGYHMLIRIYVKYIKAKLEFHRIHPEFNGSFDYDQYMSQKGISNLDEGYTTISELMDLMEHVDQLALSIIKQFRGGSDNELRQSALIPLVEESFGMYKFMTSMLTSMFGTVENVEALIPLKDRYNTLFYSLKAFYEECKSMRYLTSIISVPDLPIEPPFLFDTEKPIRKQVSNFVPVKPLSPPLPHKPLLEDLIDTGPSPTYSTIKPIAMNQNPPPPPPVATVDPLLPLIQEKDYYKTMADQCQQKIAKLEMDLNQLGLSTHHQNDTYIKSLLDQIEMWKNKYETTSKMYQNLRSEHLEALNKLKELNDKLASMNENMQSLQQSSSQNADKNALLAKLVNEKNAQELNINKLKENHQDEINRIRRENMELKSKMKDVAESKGDEVQSILDKFMKEKQESDELFRAQIDQALVMIANMQNTFMEKENKHLEDMQKLQRQFDAMMDSLFFECETKIQKAIEDYTDENVPGNPYATPEVAISEVERAVSSIHQLKQSLNPYLMGNAASLDNIAHSNEFIASLESLLSSLKTLSSTLSPEKAKLVFDLIHSQLGPLSSNLFQFLQSKSLKLSPESSRPSMLNEKTGGLVNGLTSFTSLLESLKQQQVQEIDEIGEILGKELSGAARAIEEAAEKLHALMAANSQNSYITPENRPILDASLAITDAIGLLIKYAAKSQEEIVAAGKGSGSPASFYKKNSRWTEGLLSAARSVASAMAILGEVADGVLKGTHTTIHLMVASDQVAAATAQLLAASRVKAIAGSKTQGLLEGAAKAVSDAVKKLVVNAKANVDAEEKRKELEETSYNLPSDTPMTSSNQQFKIDEMNQQIEVYTREEALNKARKKLDSIRKASYSKHPNENNS